MPKHKRFWIKFKIKGTFRNGNLQRIFAHIRVRKKYWLIPVIVMLLLIGTLVVLTGGSALAPFIYTLF